MKSQASPSARDRRWQRIAGYVVPGVLVGVVGAGSLFAQHRLGAPPWTLPVAVALILILSVRPIVIWWNAFDEVAKEAHRESWFWGGSVGLTVSVVIMMVVRSYPGTLRGAGLDPIDVFMAGTATVFLPMVIGYLLWWSAWWLKRR